MQYTEDKKMRYSKQRERIYEYLCSSMDHPSAEQIYLDLRKEMPNLSLGTVYRNLKVLVELGQIKTIDSKEGIEHYDANCCNHIHFICENCGTIYDVMNINYELLEKSLNLNEEFKLNKINLSMYGICNKCK